jgi:hypothetical protein
VQAVDKLAQMWANPLIFQSKLATDEEALKNFCRYWYRPDFHYQQVSMFPIYSIHYFFNEISINSFSTISLLPRTYVFRQIYIDILSQYSIYAL